MDGSITLGKDETGNLISVETQRSGKGDLVCPFCAAPLIAVRGALNAHHFRHDGDTCRESLGELPAIPGWDHFHLSLPAEVVQYLRQHRDGFDASDPLTRRLRSLGLISRNSYTGWDELSDTGKVVAGTLSLSKFDGWFRERLQARLSDKRALVDAGQLHPAHFEIEAWRQQQILSASLYVLEITAADGTVFHKVGRTRRDAQQRLAEVLQDVSTALQIHASARVLRTLPMAGYLFAYGSARYESERRTSTQPTEPPNVAGLTTEAEVRAAVDAAVPLPGDIQDSNTKVDLRFGLTMLEHKVSIEVWGNNVFDERTKFNTFNIPLRGFTGERARGQFVQEPRTYGLTLRKDF